MEQGVEPLARMIWAPSPTPKPREDLKDQPQQDPDRSPLREPPITADPLVLRDQPAVMDDDWDAGDDSLPLPPDLPPPVLLEDALDQPQPPEPLEESVNEKPPVEGTRKNRTTRRHLLRTSSSEHPPSGVTASAAGESHAAAATSP